MHSNQVATNLQQVYKGYWDRPYPYDWHKEFKKYGKYAGFKDSFFEKYWFFAPGTTSQIARGEVVMMTSHPFPMHDGKLGRALIVRGADHYGNYGYGNHQLSEDLIQKMFKEERIKPYDLPAFPTPPPEAPRTRFPDEPPEWLYQVNLFFDRLSQNMGLGFRGWLLRDIVAGFLIFSAIAAVWFLWRQTRRH